MSETYKKNYLVYFYGYLSITIMISIINAYLPIYFLNELNIPKEQVAIVLLFSMLILLLKPVVSIYFDFNPSKTKKYATLGAIILELSFVILILTILFFFNLPLFGIFLTIAYGLISIVDSAIDKYIITTSSDRKSENKNILLFQIGSVFGSIITSVLFLIIGNWMLLFISNIIISLPLIFIIFRLQEPTGEFSISKTSLREDLSKALQSKPLLIMCVFLFLYSVNYLFDWVLEPWIDATYPGGANLYFLFLIIFIFFNIFGFYLGPKLSAKYSEVKISLVLMIFCGVIYIIAPFLDLLIMLILFSIVQVFAGIITICLTSVVIGISEKKVVLFQFMGSIMIIARIIYTPLGLFLYTFLDGNVIVAITGVVFIISAIPLYFLEYERKGE